MSKPETLQTLFTDVDVNKREPPKHKPDQIEFDNPPAPVSRTTTKNNKENDWINFEQNVEKEPAKEYKMVTPFEKSEDLKPVKVNDKRSKESDPALNFKVDYLDGDKKKEIYKENYKPTLVLPEEKEIKKIDEPEAKSTKDAFEPLTESEVERFVDSDKIGVHEDYKVNKKVYQEKDEFSVEMMLEEPEKSNHKYTNADHFGASSKQE